MDGLQIVFVNTCIALAAILQAATGIGFGLVGGPALLTAVPPATALVNTSLLSLGIALSLIPFFLRHVAWADLGRLCLGGLAGLPFGVLIYAHAGATAVKLAAAATVGFALLSLLAPLPTARARTPRAGFAVGAASAVLGVALSMPGPLAAAYLLRERLDKTAVRATVLAFFLPAYSVIMVLQFMYAGPAEVDMRIAWQFAPAVIIGIAVGQVLSRVLSERSFRLALQWVLGATVLSLAISAGLGDGP